MNYDTIFVVLGLELGLSFYNVFRRVSELIKTLISRNACSRFTVLSAVIFEHFTVESNMVTMADEEHASKDLGRTTATDITSTSDSNADHELHFVRRGEAVAEASSSQESIDGYDPELMSGRTLLTAEEEKKLLRKIDWRLMTLCSLIFMFKNLDSNNVREQPFPSWITLCYKITYSLAGIQCSNHEQGNGPEHHDTARNYI